MIDIELLRTNPDLFRASMKKRNLDANLIDAFLTLDKEWREALTKVETMRSEQKKLGEQRKIEEAKALKEQIAALTVALEATSTARMAAIKKIPNLILEGVPEGKDDSQNVTLREVGEKPTFSFQSKDYVELSE